MEKSNEKQIEILHIAKGLNVISAALMESDGIIGQVKELLEKDFDRIHENSNNASFLRNLLFAVEMNEHTNTQLTVVAGKLSSLSDVIIGSHVLFLDKYAIVDGIAMKTIMDNELAENIPDVLDSTKEETLEVFKAIFSNEDNIEASLKMVFGTKDEESDNIKEDAIAILSGNFHKDTWNLLSSFGRVSTSPSYFKRVTNDRTIGYSVLMDSGIRMLDAVIGNIEGFSDEIQKDLNRFTDEKNK